MRSRLRKNKFKIFFLCLVVFLLIEPLDTPVIDTFLGIALFILFSFSPYLISPSRKTFSLSLTALAICTFIQLIPPDSVGETARFGGEILGLCIFCIVISYIFWYTVSSEVVSTDLIYLSLCGYFLIGIGFYMAYSVLQDMGLMVFKPAGVLTKDELMYYSYTALTTTGFGDYVPVTAIGRRLTSVESCTGVLYVAVLIGRLIGLHAGSRRKSGGTTDTA